MENKFCEFEDLDINFYGVDYGGCLEQLLRHGIFVSLLGEIGISRIPDSYGNQRYC